MEASSTLAFEVFMKLEPILIEGAHLPEIVMTTPELTLKQDRLRVQALVIVLTKLRNTTTNGYGHGFLPFSNRRKVVTARHNITDPDRIIFGCIHPFSGEYYKVVSSRLSDKADVAILELDRPIPGPVVKMASLHPNIGTQVALSTCIEGETADERVTKAYTKRFDFAARWATVAGEDVAYFLGDENTRFPVMSYLINARPGMSGAPLFNMQDEVVGMHSAGSWSQLVSMSVPLPVLREELKKLL
jgi:S1-C subfamily serine protease